MWKSFQKNEKGLTLIELLGVLVIVGIIAAIAVPAISGTISKSKEKADAASISMIEEAALRYVIDTDASTTTTVDIDTLVKQGYLNSTPVLKTKTIKSVTAAKDGVNWKITENSDSASNPPE
ncbi:prepilin-type N-terminal cleavage/methylation domain-containing protein [Paenibacillus protaetiae]|uniref:Prepilin-type N-terminal cleavage/methylation domain-containing protein n=1 Tax=Paenibacillus protaetiae TaxID=2509456 RepID=A0A4P6EYD1_9BACL|nr:prepilin-type N-terminal cleavage/methylation domain-containing protein [Paenibacillus protaetiae]QAY68420.1 prepilin-type N-terminal cleavage/methylation domain-containing protein [Paenibacillus protaetiae]